MREKLGIKATANAKIILFCPGPNILIKISANKTLGNATIASFTLINISSNQPPKYPVKAPRNMPIILPNNTVEIAMKKVVPIPFITRLNTSLPN